MKYRVAIIYAVLFSLIFLTSGCARVENKEKISALQTSIKRYGQAIRWARYKDMHDFHLGKDGVKPKLSFDKYKGIQVTEYNIIEDGSIDEELIEADVVAEISYYDEEYATVQTIKHHQHWWYEPKLKSWFVEAPLPEFR